MPARKSTNKGELAAPGVDAERRPRLALAGGGVLLGVGLALVGGGPSDFGKFLALAALLLLIYGVHSFGRLGPA